MLSLALSGCSRENSHEETQLKSRVEDMSWGPIEMTVTAEPAEVQFDRDIILTIRISSDKGIIVDSPQIADRLTGFLMSGEYGGQTITSGDKNILEKHARLTPVISEEYRIAPMAITYQDARRSPPLSSWFATKAISFNAHNPSTTASSTIKDELNPIWVYPSWKEVGMILLMIAASLAAVWLIFRLAKKLHTEAELRKLSPKERALRELEVLLAKHLPDRELFKEFYIELTMIVRRYIERKHTIRAPEQTTEEFLIAVSNDPRFSLDVLTTLRNFLEAADLVKFAAYQPDGKAVSDSVNTARNYLDTDTMEADRNV